MGFPFSLLIKGVTFTLRQNIASFNSHFPHYNYSLPSLSLSSCFLFQSLPSYQRCTKFIAHFHPHFPHAWVSLLSFLNLIKEVSWFLLILCEVHQLFNAPTQQLLHPPASQDVKTWSFCLKSKTLNRRTHMMSFLRGGFLLIQFRPSRVVSDVGWYETNKYFVYSGKQLKLLLKCI